MNVNNVKCDLFDSVTKPDQIDAYQSININPQDGITVIGQRVVDGKIVALYGTNETLESDEFLVFGSNFGCGVVGHGYGYGYGDGGSGELEYFSHVEYGD
jgi:hypothetical protein